jgi:hypothetical protein
MAGLVRIAQALFGSAQPDSPYRCCFRQCRFALGASSALRRRADGRHLFNKLLFTTREIGLPRSGPYRAQFVRCERGDRHCFRSTVLPPCNGLLHGGGEEDCGPSRNGSPACLGARRCSSPHFPGWRSAPNWSIRHAPTGATTDHKLSFTPGPRWSESRGR